MALSRGILSVTGREGVGVFDYQSFRLGSLLGQVKIDEASIAREPIDREQTAVGRSRRYRSEVHWM
jgi:hypothetical protein